MSQTKTVVINGRLYDELTGMPVEEITNVSISTEEVTPKTEGIFVESQSRPRSQSAHSVHANTQRSQTLNRRHTKRPESVATTRALSSAKNPTNIKVRQVVQKSPAISKFAPYPEAAGRRATVSAQPVTKPQAIKKSAATRPATLRRQMNDIAPQKHPLEIKTALAQKSKQAISSSQAIKTPARPVSLPTNTTMQPRKQTSQTRIDSKAHKNHQIEQALKNAPDKKSQKTPKKASFLARHPRLATFGSAGLAALLLGGYFTYLNIPNISVRVAAAQSGIDASYPRYQPDGYSLNGPVAADKGKVQMKFASNSGPSSYKVTQQKSAWDSSAVIDNLVSPKSNDSYVTTHERGLTIYTFSGDAAWVNGGILYTIEGDAPLSSEQIRRIATSL